MSRISRRIKSEIGVPGDKSISHRALMVSSISIGITKISNFLFSHDSISTLNCLRDLGVKIEMNNRDILVHGNGLYSFKSYDGILDVRNSGTTIRLLSGILSGNKIKSVIDGDDSIRRRPMDRIIKPLSLMGARIFGKNGEDFAPIYIEGNDLKSICYKMEIHSAQVKSCILFAGLYGDSVTKIFESVKTRDHTERMLKYFGSQIEIEDKTISIKKSELVSNDVMIPGDISSASFFMVLAAGIEGAEILIRDVGINSTRTGIIDVLKMMGVTVELLNVRERCFETVCDVKVYGSARLNSVSIRGDIIPRLIDEIPIICVLCCFAEGVSKIENIGELRYKESDRIASIISEFRKLGVSIYEIEDGIEIHGGGKIKPAVVDSHNDHRIAMALNILTYISGVDIKIRNKDCVDVSFPLFYEKLRQILK